jgi:hypothetical protein
MTEMLGNVVCECAVAEDGELLIYPQPGETLDALRELRRRVTEGESMAKWEYVPAPSGTMYPTLFLIFKPTGEERAAVSLVLPPNVPSLVPPGELHVAVVVNQVDDPTDDRVTATEAFHLRVPPLRSAS